MKNASHYLVFSFLQSKQAVENGGTHIVSKTPRRGLLGKVWNLFLAVIEESYVLLHFQIGLFNSNFINSICPTISQSNNFITKGIDYVLCCRNCVFQLSITY